MKRFRTDLNRFQKAFKDSKKLLWKPCWSLRNLKKGLEFVSFLWTFFGFCIMHDTFLGVSSYGLNPIRFRLFFFQWRVENFWRIKCRNGMPPTVLLQISKCTCVSMAHVSLFVLPICICRESPWYCRILCWILKHSTRF